MVETIIKSGAWVPVLIMAPNIVWMLLPSKDRKEQVSAPFYLTMSENIGRMAVLILPFFYTLNLTRNDLILGLMAAALAVYYLAWIRYFTGGRVHTLFWAPLCGIPFPMAVAPVVFLLLSSYLMESWWMFGAAIVFGVAHIQMTILERNSARD